MKNKINKKTIEKFTPKFLMTPRLDKNIFPKKHWHEPKLFDDKGKKIGKVRQFMSYKHGYILLTEKGEIYCFPKDLMYIK